MSDLGPALGQIGCLVVALAIAVPLLGRYLAHLYTSPRHLRVERWTYRALRVDPDADQYWRTYALSVLGFSLMGVLVLDAFGRLQGHLPLSLGFAGLPADGAWNTAVSFVTNTNWQWYSGESTLGHLMQMLGLTVQNFASAAVGMAVAAAFARALARTENAGRVGNFFADLVRTVFRVLLPLSVLAAVAMVLAGAVQNFSSDRELTTLDGGPQVLTGGPVASQEAIKELGTNGGGFYNVNSAHPLFALVLHQSEDTDQLSLATLTLLAATVIVALVGGLLPALLAALVAFLTLNFVFTPPVGTLTIAEPRNLVVLLVFVALAVAVASVVDRASRRAADAIRARREAATMSGLSRSVLTGQDTAEAVVERVRESFGQRSVALLTRTDSGWDVTASSGDPCAATPAEGDTQARVDDEHVLVLCGPPLQASDQRVLEAFSVQASLVLEYRRLRERDLRAASLEKADATSTALLRAVSHDLRTPLAIMRAAVNGLLIDGVDDTEREELVETVNQAAEQQESLIEDLLDLSRLQTGLVRPQLAAYSLEEILPLAAAGHPPGAVSLEVDETTPAVLTDPGLLTRVVANLISNAVTHADGVAVRVLAHALPETVEVMVADRGPGVSPDQREHMFDPFQRLGDTSGTGLGLGLAVARGLTEAVGGTISPEDTPGGGLTMVVSLPRAREDAAPQVSLEGTR